jgi:hypothetical protein
MSNFEAVTLVKLGFEDYVLRRLAYGVLRTLTNRSDLSSPEVHCGDTTDRYRNSTDWMGF